MKLNTYDLPAETLVIRRTYSSPSQSFFIFKGYDATFSTIQALQDEIDADSAVVFVDDEENIFSLSIMTYTVLPRNTNYDYEFRGEVLDNFETYQVTSL